MYDRFGLKDHITETDSLSTSTWCIRDVVIIRNRSPFLFHWVLPRNIPPCTPQEGQQAFSTPTWQV